MRAIDLSTFVEENETADTRAYEHALDISYQIVKEMEAQGLNQKQLAHKMGISPARLSTMLNTQPNMTLKSLAQFELALGIKFTITSQKHVNPMHILEGVLPQTAYKGRCNQNLHEGDGLRSNCTKSAITRRSKVSFTIAA